MTDPRLEETIPPTRLTDTVETESSVLESPKTEVNIAEAATVPPHNRIADRFVNENTARNLTVSFVVATGREAKLWERDPDELSRVSAAFAPGVVLQGRYELIRELGRGGMGVVYMGRDVRLNRLVAIKAILGDGGLDDTKRLAFADEARMGANLTHPAIATVYDYGFQDGNPFAVFEFIPGLTLRELLGRREKLPLDEVRLIVGSLAQALDFAHERHVVHRDLKPENIRSTEQGQFKLLDLGLAKDFHSHCDWSFCGTPAYASPEQASALPCDGRTDQYALALITYEMLAGIRPFNSDDWITLLDKHANEPPPRARSVQPDVPDSVEDALDKALSKDPNHRFASCIEFATALGCSLLAAPAQHVVEILLETTCKKMDGRWKSFVEPFNIFFHKPRVHLTLSPDAFWATYRSQLMRWPIKLITQIDRQGRWLRIQLNVAHGKKVQRFKLPSRKESQEWLERVEGLIKESKPCPVETDLPPAITEELGEPTNDPIVLLKTKPSTRFQLLGPLDVKTTSRKLAKPALAIRGIMIGADAVVDLEEERLPGAFKTEYRASGTAVRAVDREGRLELKARWFDAQAVSLRLGTIALALFGVVGGLSQLMIQLLSTKASSTEASGYLVGLTMSSVSLLGAVAFLALTIAFGILRWPQLARPVGVCFMGSAAAWVISILVAIVSGLMSLSMVTASINLLSVIFVMAFTFSIFTFYLYLGKRTLSIDREYRRIVADDEDEVSPIRRNAGMGAMIFAIAYVALMIATTLWMYSDTRSSGNDEAVASAREDALRGECVNNLKLLGSALNGYHSANARFPGNIVDKNGKPLLSWRVAILPYLDQKSLYQKFKLDEPWDSPTNKALLEEMPENLLCPSQEDYDAGMTWYQGWAGPKTFFDPAMATSIKSITDGTAGTITIAEADKPVPWTKPVDMPFDPSMIAPMFGAGRAHSEGFLACFADGTVRFIKPTISRDTLSGLITINGGEVIPTEAY